MEMEVEGCDEKSDSRENEQRKVMTDKLSLILGACSTFQDMIYGTESDSGRRKQLPGHLNRIIGTERNSVTTETQVS